MSSNDSVVVVGAKRTPIGALQGALAAVTAPQLGAAALRAAQEQAGLSPETADEVLMGCVLPAGVGQAPARQAALAAGYPVATPCTTVSKVCGSGMKAVMLGHDLIAAGSATVVATGGMESMTNAPYLLSKARGGYRLGHGQLLDHMFLDGLEDAYEGKLMGTYAEQAVAEFGFSREQQDAYTIESIHRARNAVETGLFKEEIAAVTVTGRGGDTVVTEDEIPGRCDPARVAGLKPAFLADGSVTAANSSSIADGAAALVLMKASEAERLGISPLVRIVGHAGTAGEPGRFTSAPVSAIKKLMAKVGWTDTDVDLYEINEAFACVTMIAMKELKLSHDKVNIHGGACALGHPIGASGARIIVTLIHALQRQGLSRGVASLCIGGGEATAIALEISR